MAETFVFAGTLSGSWPKLVEITLGTGGAAKGDALSIGTSGDVGKLVKNGGAGTTAIVAVAMATGSAGDVISVLPVTADTVFEALAAATTGYVFGTACDLTSSTQTVATGSTANAAFRILDDLRSANTVKVINGESRVKGVFSNRLF